MASRSAKVSRKTKETEISVSLDVDGAGKANMATGVGFFDHMLDQLSRHSLIDMTVKAKGDLHIDDHHTVEDTGIAIGQALSKALGERRGIMRYASIDLAMDETLTRAAIDVSGRPFLVWNVAFSSPKIGTFDTELVREFFQALTQNAGVTLHVTNHYGANNHHIAETCFKAVARVLACGAGARPAPAGRRAVHQGQPEGLGHGDLCRDGAAGCECGRGGGAGRSGARRLCLSRLPRAAALAGVAQVVDRGSACLRGERRADGARRDGGIGLRRCRAVAAGLDLCRAGRAGASHQCAQAARLARMGRGRGERFGARRRYAI